jgi:hypothetical protein
MEPMLLEPSRERELVDRLHQSRPQLLMKAYRAVDDDRGEFNEEFGSGCSAWAK